MIKLGFLLSFIFFSPLSVSLPIVAQNDSLFDDSDLADIEGFDSEDEDQELEDEFESVEDESYEDNFDEDDFETFEEEEIEEKEITDAESEEEKMDDFDKKDYEIISDRPDYEVISDEELEKEFEEEEGLEEKESESGLKSDPLEEEIALPLKDEESQVLEELEEEPDDIIEVPSEEDIGERETEDPPVLKFEEIEEEENNIPEEPIEEIEEIEEDLPEDPFLKEEDFSEEALNLITNIRYLATEDRIIIDCSEPTSYQVRKNEETNQFIIEILEARLADNLHWPYVLRDFNTNFGLIKADQKDSNTVRIIIQMKEGADFPQSTLTENGDQILISYGQVVEHQIVQQRDVSKPLHSSNILPAQTLEDLYFGDLKFSGSSISFHVIDAPIKQVLRFISEESGMNMVIGENVQGSITLKLENVPWDQALHTIFKVKSLGYTRDGNVITILPLDEIEARTKKLKEIADRQKSLTPFETKVILISYGKIDEIASKVKDFSTPSSDVSKGGKIIIHSESNTFVVIDTPAVIKKIEALVQYLDKPPKQVMVEAKIVEVGKNFARNFGLKWGIGGYIPPVNINAGGIVEFFQNISGDYIGSSEGTAGLNLNLPIIGDIDASLSLAESDGHAQVISSPKVIVISGKSASITKDTPVLIPVATNTTQNNDGGTSSQQSFERESVSISLNVTPTVTTTGSVFLQVDVTRSDPGGVGGAFKTSRSAKTEVLAKNGQTIVIGGIYERDQVVDNQGIPFLKDIPFLNLLFNARGINKSQSELLVFITPRLLDSHE